MTFNKYSQENKTFPVLVLVGTVVLFAGLFISFEIMAVLLFVSVLIMIIYGFSVFYEKHIDDYLTISFVKSSVKNYQGDEGYIEVMIEQKGILPLLNARLVLEMDDVIHFKEGRVVPRRFKTIHTRTFNLLFWEKRTFKIPYEANKRGVARVHDLELVVPNLFGFGSIFLRAQKIFNQEVVVYPKRKVVPNIDLLSPKRMGHHRARHSLFDEQSLPVGTREYEPGDAFNKIHWKATAKEGNLQTKVFEKSSQISWCFLLNVRSYNGISAADDIESLIEKIAYMTYYATKHQIPYRIFINITSINQIPFMHQLEGEGEAHYRQTLELLARMKIFTFTTPYERMLHFVWKHETPPAYIIQVGATNEEQQRYLNLIAKKGSEIYYLDNDGLENRREGKVKQHG
ncbi:DUF58 domain-containing protein [Alkalibacillus aidingensis]|uniref:DUF58 domain-containing protein n=1 Tax=Alkalibacillus aidingensis TaxID=2747607 RepID=UPI001660134C|nr:DUF58 domain-containing protein [Alkalibacillus aidingensis]